MIYLCFSKDLDHGKFFGIPIYRFTIEMLSFYGILLQLHGDLWGLLMILWDINDNNNWHCDPLVMHNIRVCELETMAQKYFADQRLIYCFQTW